MKNLKEHLIFCVAGLLIVVFPELVESEIHTVSYQISLDLVSLSNPYLLLYSSTALRNKNCLKTNVFGIQKKINQYFFI